MAFASIPPVGSLQTRMSRIEARRREETTQDPIERYNLRTARIKREMTEFGAALLEQAKNNAKAAAQRELEAQRIERQFYINE